MFVLFSNIKILLFSKPISSNGNIALLPITLQESACIFLRYGVIRVGILLSNRQWALPRALIQLISN